VGGGIVRDVLVATIPGVLQRELYPVAALAGALVVVAGHALSLPAAPVAVAGAVACFVLRWLAIRRGWRLPVARDGGMPWASRCAGMPAVDRTDAETPQVVRQPWRAGSAALPVRSVVANNPAVRSAPAVPVERPLAHAGCGTARICARSLRDLPAAGPDVLRWTDRPPGLSAPRMRQPPRLARRRALRPAGRAVPVPARPGQQPARLRAGPAARRLARCAGRLRRLHPALGAGHVRVRGAAAAAGRQPVAA